MKKGRHRRFEEARALKRSDTGLDVADILGDAPPEPCEECGAGADDPCASWCLARVDDT